MNYEDCLNLVANNKNLNEYIEFIVEESKDDYLNLIHKDWEKHLKNDNLYQKYQNNKVAFQKPMQYTYVQIQRVSRTEDYMKVIVLGTFTLNKTDVKKFNQNYSLFFQTLSCPPLEEIGKVFAGEKKKLEVNGNAKFFVESCGGSISCPPCSSYIDTFGLNEEKPWWCIEKTKVFDGETVKKSYRDVVEEHFARTNFLAVMKVLINCRQFFGDDYDRMKLSGFVKDFIIFKENNLEQRKASNLEFLIGRRLTVASTATMGIVPRNTQNDQVVHSNGEKQEPTSKEYLKTENDNFSFTPKFAKQADQVTEQKHPKAVVCLPEKALQDYQHQQLKRETEKNEQDSNFDVVHNRQTKFI